jgi:hypothetical protein
MKLTKNNTLNSYKGVSKRVGGNTMELEALFHVDTIHQMCIPYILQTVLIFSEYTVNLIVNLISC